jgi:hypothetical protein
MDALVPKVTYYQTGVYLFTTNGKVYTSEKTERTINQCIRSIDKNLTVLKWRQFISHVIDYFISGFNNPNHVRDAMNQQSGHTNRTINANYAITSAQMNGISRIDMLGWLFDQPGRQTRRLMVLCDSRTLAFLICGNRH